MTVSLTSTVKSLQSVQATGGIQKYLEAHGRMPPVSIIVTPLDKSPNFVLDQFLHYKFASSILTPVDSFEFNFVAPDDSRPFNKYVKDGDLITLYGAGIRLATGIVDHTDVEVDKEFGEKIAIQGRDLMGQLEDQDAVSAVGEMIWGNLESVDSALRKLIKDTRIQKIVKRDASKRADWLLATEPGENKLAALQRFIEPMNVLAWMDPSGNIIVGRPNMAQAPSGKILCSKTKRDSNVISIRATRGSTTIPNIVLPIFTGQESVKSRVPKGLIGNNDAAGPKRLRDAGHLVAKAVTVSNPQSGSPQDLAQVNELKAFGSDRRQAYAKREIARQNIKELDVMCKVAGHYNENGQPYLPDTVYNIEFDRGDVNQKMYLYSVDYNLDESTGQTTDLRFCNLGTIVSDIVVG